MNKLISFNIRNVFDNNLVREIYHSLPDKMKLDFTKLDPSEQLEYTKQKIRGYYEN